MKERISKVRKIATIIFIGITVLGWAGTYVLAFICGPIITSEQYGEIMNTFALIYCPMAFVYLLLMLCGKMFEALYQAFGDRLILGNKKSATAFLISAEKEADGATVITAEFTDKTDGSRKQRSSGHLICLSYPSLQQKAAVTLHMSSMISEMSNQ